MTKNIILYVEDKEYQRIAMRDLFLLYEPELSSRYPLETIATGEEALTLALANLADIAIVCADGDLGIGMSGWDLVRKLKESGYTNPAIFMGNTELPKGAKELFTETSPDKATKLIEILKKYLK